MGKGIDGSSNCAYPEDAMKVAKNSRTAKAGTFKGGTPPSGPKPEPVLTDKVPRIKSTGVSGKGSPAK